MLLWALVLFCWRKGGGCGCGFRGILGGAGGAGCRGILELGLGFGGVGERDLGLLHTLHPIQRATRKPYNYII